MKSAQPIKVILADDQELLIASFERLLDAYGVTAVGKSTAPEEVVNLYEEKRPDVLILDIRFGQNMTGLDAAKQVLKKFPNANIVFLSQYDQDSLIKEAYRIGARAFLTKGCSPDDLANAITKAHKGERFFLPEVAGRLANIAVDGDTSPQSKLDERELEVFVYMANGLTMAEIAEKLHLSIKSISNTSLAIKNKLDVHRPADFTRLALKHGLIEP